eukprot:jgi/Tetstr1/454176/TSEL_041095.t1
MPSPSTLRRGGRYTGSTKLRVTFSSEKARDNGKKHAYDNRYALKLWDFNNSGKLAYTVTVDPTPKAPLAGIAASISSTAGHAKTEVKPPGATRFGALDIAKKSNG